MNLQSVTLKGEQVTIDDSQIFNAIGSDVVLEGCTLRCSVPSESLSICGKLLNTTVIIENELTGFSWLDAKLIQCKFLGHFKENEFGTLSGSNGCCQAGAFKGAVMDDCTFYGPASESNIYPAWPHFVILNPHMHFEAMKNCPMSVPLSDVVYSIEFLDEEATAVAYNADALAQWLSEDIEAIKRFFSQFPFVRM